jgi:hypothetical protein
MAPPASDNIINSAIDFFALVGAGDDFEVDNDSGLYSPEALKEVQPEHVSHLDIKK